MSIPAGLVRAGSAPGTAGRIPEVEVGLVPIEIPAFGIDRLPYPNDPQAPPRTGATRAEAAQLCAAAGKRLCTELEWERACKGETDRRYPHGDELDLERCNLDPSQCQSPFGVAWMGLAGYEWTSNDVNPGLGNTVRTAVVRGARLADPVADHRCAARHAVRPDLADGTTVFRCCSGTAPSTPYPDAELRRSFRPRPMEDEAMARVLASVPELAGFATDFELFSAIEVDQALARGELTRETLPLDVVDGVLEWAPTRGELLWVFAGRGGGSSLVAALYPLPQGGYRHAASFVFEGETVPIALAFGRAERHQIHFSSCWGCLGEDGVIEYREDNTVLIAQ